MCIFIRIVCMCAIITRYTIYLTNVSVKIIFMKIKKIIVIIVGHSYFPIVIGFVNPY